MRSFLPLEKLLHERSTGPDTTGSRLRMSRAIRQRAHSVPTLGCIASRFGLRKPRKRIRRRVFRATLTQVRSALVLGTLLYSAFGVLDAWIAPAQREWLWLIRYGVVAPLMVFVIAFTYYPSFTRYRENVVSGAVLVAALGIVAMTAIIPAPGNYLYYAGVVLALVYMFTLVRLGIPYSLSISAATIALIWRWRCRYPDAP